MPILALALLFALCLTGFAVAQAYENSYLRVYGMEIHTFKTPHFKLGIFFEEMETAGRAVDVLTIGLGLFNLTMEAYKTEEEYED